MTKNQKNLVVVAVAAAVVGLFLGGLFGGKPSLGGSVEHQQTAFINGFRVGLSNTLVMDGSGNFTVPGTLAVTGATTLTGALSLSGNLSVANASVSGDLELTTNGGDLIALGDLSIEDITASGSQTVAGTLGVTGLLTGVNASLSGDFELTTNGGDIFALGDLTVENITASSSISSSLGSSSFDGLIAAKDAWFGASAASGSLGDVTILDATATASLIFDSGADVGSCIEMRNTVGAAVYARVVGSTWTVNTTSCK